MKKTNSFLIIATLCAFFTTNTLQAQLKVNSFGKTLIGQQTAASINYDQDNILSASIFGSYGDYRSGSKLSFGDFSRIAQNVFIGEYGTGDSDQLWLQGRDGFFLTRNGSASDIIAYCPSATADRIYFNLPLSVKGVFYSSDGRFKSNIAKIQSPLSKLMSLDGLSYDYNDKIKSDGLLKKYDQFNSISETNEKNSTQFSEKETISIESQKKMETLKTKKEHKMGFIAQDLQKIFPDLVKEDDMGYLGIDYIGLIPVIVEAMKEQQNTIVNLQEEIKSLRSNQSFDNTIIPGNENSNESISLQAKLFQNTPNPFTAETKIKYYVPENASSAKIAIYDLQGKEVDSYNIANKRNGNLVIKGSKLNAGMYFYSLLVDNQLIDTKRMVLTK